LKPVKAIYAVLGSGGIGLALAKELETRTKNIILVDNDSAKVETLKEQNLNAVQGISGISKFYPVLISRISNLFLLLVQTLRPIRRP